MSRPAETTVQALALLDLAGEVTSRAQASQSVASFTRVALANAPGVRRDGPQIGPRLTRVGGPGLSRAHRRRRRLGPFRAASVPRASLDARRDGVVVPHPCG